MFKSNCSGTTVTGFCPEGIDFVCCLDDTTESNDDALIKRYIPINNVTLRKNNTVRRIVTPKNNVTLRQNSVPKNNNTLKNNKIVTPKNNVTIRQNIVPKGSNTLKNKNTIRKKLLLKIMVK